MPNNKLSPKLPTGIGPKGPMTPQKPAVHGNVDGIADIVRRGSANPPKTLPKPKGGK